MRKSFASLSLALAALFLSLPLLAATDFSGTWVLDKGKSDLNMGRGGRGGEAPDITMTIKQAANELVVSRTMSMGGNERTTEQKFTLDGKENTNSQGRAEFVSKSTWEDGNLVIEGTQKMSSPRGEMEFQTKEVYSLSDDGKVLTITTTRSTPQGERTSKQVYNRQ